MSETPAEAIVRIELELAGLRAARLAASQGKQVQDAERDGRRIRYSTFTLEQFNQQERYLEGQLQQAKIDAGQTVTPRRTAISGYYG